MLKSVSYGNIVGLLIEAIKEQQREINSIKQNVRELKNEEWWISFLSSSNR